MKKYEREPQAFLLDEKTGAVKTVSKRKASHISFAHDIPGQDVVVVPYLPKPALNRRLSWGSILIGALSALIALWAGLTTTQMIESFFAQSVFLGWLSLAIASIAGIAALAIIIREIFGFVRLRRIENLQLCAAHALNQDDKTSADQTVKELKALYASRSDAAWNLSNFNSHQNDILDPRDHVHLAERYLVEPLDEIAHGIIARRAKRVTLLTTVTPAATLDILFVGAQNIAMLREIATLYGGRPSVFSTLKLARMVVAHLAIAGGLALSDNFLNLFIGKGLLGRLSTRFGEGAVNGILTSRIGLAACEVCRPIPKEATKRETLSSLLKEIAKFGDKKTAE
jgi:putative membrane protein